MSSPRSVGWGAQAGLLLGSILLCALIAEVGLRLVWRGPTGGAAEERAEAGLSLRDIAKPNLDGSFLGLPFRTNSRGIRGPELAARPEPGVFRILFTGDSVTMGWRVEEAQAYPSVVGRKWNAEGGPAGFRVESVNAGLAGVNIAGAMDRLEANAAAYSPDLLVYGYTINDIEGPAYRKKQSPKRAMQLMLRHKRYAESPSYLVRFIWPRMSALRERLSPTLVPYTETLHDNYFDNPEAWQAVEEGLDRLAVLARQRGLCAHLLVHAELSDLDADEHDYLDIYERVEEAARALEISVSQSFPYFEGRDGEALKAAFLDNHPGAEGHELLADALLAGLRALPEACFAKEPGALDAGR